MAFQIKALPVAGFRDLFGFSEAELAAKGIVRVVAEAVGGYPCRVSLREAEAGENLLLLNYEHQDAATPYRSRHAIYVIEGAAEARPGVDEVPEILRSRLLSVRGFDAVGMMRAADVVEGVGLEAVVARMFDVPEVEYLHVHNAKPGCFAARVERV
jgi:hypothetical protein